MNTGDWGLYPWDTLHGAGFIHPDSLDEFEELYPRGKIFQLMSVEGEYINLRHGDRFFQVKPSLFEIVPGPRFDIGFQAELKKNGKKGVVVGIEWHFKEARPYYTLAFDGRAKSTRYWDEDFV